VSRSKPTEAEQKVLDAILRAMRVAVRRTTQVCMTFDPFVAGGGAHLFVSYNDAGWSQTIEGDFKAGHPPARRR
jgi:hypothetical protein